LNDLKVFIDFDETLFNHYAYLDWAELFLKKFGMSPGAYRKTVDSFHTDMGEKLRLYNHEDHILSASGKQWSYISGEFERELSKNNHDFCYDDAHAFLHEITKSPYDVRILTYGNGEYQRYKIKTCKTLEKLHIPVHVVTQPKREFLAENFSEVAGILVDDKYPLNLPKKWTHFWINRAEQLSAPKHDKKTDTVQISGLNQVSSMLKVIL
jgi:hypothetical protein